MKIYFPTRSVAIAALLLISVASCKKNEGGSNTIVGEWEGRSLILKTTITGGSTSSSTKNYASGHGPYAGFKSDNTYFYRDSASGPNNETGSYTFTNNLLITTPSGSSASDTSGLILNGDQFTLTQDEYDAPLAFNFAFTFARVK